MNLQPFSTSVGDIFFWESQVTIASNAVGANAAPDSFQLDSDRAFVLLSIVGSTNYDSYAGDFIAAVGGGPAPAFAGVTPPFVPNNFQVRIQVNKDWYFMDQPVPQACLCSNGTFTGPMLPIPVLFAPMTTFDFEFTNVAKTLQLTATGAAKALQINLGLVGYFVKNAAMADFLETYPAYAREAVGPIQSWLQKFSSIDATPFG